MQKGLISSQPKLAQPLQRSVATLLLDGNFISEATRQIKQACRSICICAYTWRWYENAIEKDIQQFNYAVAQKVKSGVDVNVLMHKKSEAVRLRDFGIRTKTLPTERVMHTKAILIDSKTLILGSHNLTERGTSENYECSLLVQDSEAVYLFEEYFTRMWQNYAEK